MANDIVSRTTAAREQISKWIETARKRENALVENAEDLRAALADKHTLMTAGFYTCRAIQLRCGCGAESNDAKQKKPTPRDTELKRSAVIPNRCPDLLDGLKYPDLTNARKSRGWPEDVRKAVAARLEKAFGPLYEGSGTWEILLKRNCHSNRSGSKGEIYKLAIALGLTWQEIETLFLLYRQGYNPHDPLDTAFYILYRYSANHNRELTWTDVMEVLTLYQLCLCGYDPRKPAEPGNAAAQALEQCRREKGRSLTWVEQLEVLPLLPQPFSQGNTQCTVPADTGTEKIQRMAKDLPALPSPGDDFFKAELAFGMAENAAYFDPFTICLPAAPAPGSVLHKMLGCVESSALYEHSRTAALALQGLLRLLAILYPEVYRVRNVTKDGLTEEISGFVRYPLTENGLPKKSTDLFTAMLDRVGAPNRSTKAGRKVEKPEDTLEFLHSRLITLNDHCDQMDAALNGRASSSRALDHDDVLLLGWFLIRGVLSGEYTAELDEREKALQEEQTLLRQKGQLEQMDLFSQHAGRILREIRNIRQSNETAEQLKHTMNSYELLLDVFSEAGLLSMSGLYLPRPMDRLVIASVLYPYEQGQHCWEEEQHKTMDDEFAFIPTRDEMILDLIHYMLDPDDPPDRAEVRK